MLFRSKQYTEKVKAAVQANKIWELYEAWQKADAKKAPKAKKAYQKALAKMNASK